MSNSASNAPEAAASAATPATPTFVWVSAVRATGPVAPLAPLSYDVELALKAPHPTDFSVELYAIAADGTVSTPHWQGTGTVPAGQNLLSTTCPAPQTAGAYMLRVTQQGDLVVVYTIVSIEEPELPGGVLRPRDLQILTPLNGPNSNFQTQTVVMQPFPNPPIVENNSATSVTASSAFNVSIASNESVPPGQGNYGVNIVLLEQGSNGDDPSTWSPVLDPNGNGLPSGSYSIVAGQISVTQPPTSTPWYATANLAQGSSGLPAGNYALSVIRVYDPTVYEPPAMIYVQFAITS